MQIFLVSPYHGGSHQAWAEGYVRHSAHQVNMLTLPARFWKWRMHGAAVTLARRFNQSGLSVDRLLVTDMLDLTTFLSLTRDTLARVPTVLYMHENQLTYPLPAGQNSGPMRRQHGERDLHYAFINYASMLAADEVWFNSAYHLDAYFAALPNFLKHFPEYNELGSISLLRSKSHVYPIGVDFDSLEEGRPAASEETAAEENPLLLWNQRWEYDKDPETFFTALEEIAAEGISFRLALCGQQYGRRPTVFDAWLASAGETVIHSGFADPATYASLLWRADIAVSTALHEFFGISIVEAMHANTLPILPNRLSYPEILPAAFHERCLYEDPAGLVQLLKGALNNLAETRSTAAAIAAVTERYDWRALAPIYDRGLTRVRA